ncbi:MAG: hypothetical protein NXH75_08005, partial [Halobacteriovoraceae bacterium]|nr:hypothetical protein [Halobacteriovoraceae bacterium]
NGQMENPVYEILSEEIEVGTDPNLDLYIPQSSDPIPRISLKINKKKGFLEVSPLTPTNLIKINGRSLEEGNSVKPGETLTVGNIVFRFHFQRHTAFEENKYVGGINRKKLLYVFVGLLTLFVLLDEEEPLPRPKQYHKKKSQIKRKAPKKEKILTQKEKEEKEKYDQMYEEGKRELRLKNYRRAYDLLEPIENLKTSYSNNYNFTYFSLTRGKLKESAKRTLIRMELLVEQRKGEKALLEACNLGQLIGGIENDLRVDFRLKRRLEKLYRQGLIPHPSCNK